jgi:hypothetical protein
MAIFRKLSESATSVMGYIMGKNYTGNIALFNPTLNKQFRRLLAPLQNR